MTFCDAHMVMTAVRIAELKSRLSAHLRSVRKGRTLPAPLGTPDAIHLATALIWRERMGALSTVATRDSALGLAARTFGFDVCGI